MFVILGDNCNCNFYFCQNSAFLETNADANVFLHHSSCLFTGKSSSKHFSYKKLLSLQSSLPSLFCLIKTVPTLSLFSSKPTGPCTTKNTRIFKKNWGILLFKSSFCLHAKQFFCFCVLKESVASCLLIKRLIQNLSCYRRLYLQLIPQSLCFEYHFLSLQLAWIFGLKASHISSL